MTYMCPYCSGLLVSAGTYSSRCTACNRNYWITGVGSSTDSPPNVVIANPEFVATTIERQMHVAYAEKIIRDHQRRQQA